ncbi:hypothetical protein A8F95_04255 [Bacillus wudalianchiensis]|uniref:Uncharacterized protein n=1 Tax=Pseudobacillus wudalianchiensis TaxID=1743143 RepID=A0A1B9B9Y9_9BACI|nr:hypothetical protein A8F95_04255 [Bacillus wudalianchiensis]
MKRFGWLTIMIIGVKWLLKKLIKQRVNRQITIRFFSRDRREKGEEQEEQGRQYDNDGKRSENDMKRH